MELINILGTLYFAVGIIIALFHARNPNPWDSNADTGFECLMITFLWPLGIFWVIFWLAGKAFIKLSELLGD